MKLCHDSGVNSWFFQLRFEMFDSLIILSKNFKDRLKELDNSRDARILDELDALTPQKLSNFLSAETIKF